MSMLYTKTKIERGKIRMGPKKKRKKKKEKRERNKPRGCAKFHLIV
jgi:hypothetical protein